MEQLAQINAAATFIRKHIAITPRIGLILGSGLGALGEQIEDPVRVPYTDIPHFKTATVEGHAGQLLAGKLSGKPVLLFQGRLHYYEGYHMNDVVFPVRCMKVLGVNNLIVTNAAGGLDPAYRPGDLMLIKDHIKMVTDSPLRGPNLDTFGPRFNDMSAPYTRTIRTLAHKCAEDMNLSLKEGVYCYMPGPSYETASEIRMLRMLGGHAVGMSTVPEVITAAHAGMRIMGLSCITNMGTGILDQPLSHEDIMTTSEQVRETFIALLKRIIDTWPMNPESAQ